MKALLRLAVVAITAIEASGQGLVVFSNSGRERIYVCDETGIYLVPASSTFEVALYYAPDGTLDESQFVQLGAAASFGPPAGYYSGGERSAPTAIPGGWGMFQVRGWESAFGATYEEAITGGLGKTGKSNIARVDTANSFTGEPPAALLGVQGFIIACPTCVPEPHVMTSALIIAALLFALRFLGRQQKLRT